MRTVFVAVVLAIVALTATSALAQSSQPDRPYRGLFASGTASADQTLTLSSTVGSGYDGDVLRASESGVERTAPRSRGTVVSTGSAMLSYSLSRTKFSFGASAHT